jgi:hypothetical protein
MTDFALSANRILNEGVRAALFSGQRGVEYRPALCAWENELFRRFPQGHQLLEENEASALIAQIFAACGRKAPMLELVAGFDDPQIGGIADVEGHRIVIETGCLYRYLVLHEIAHLLVPEDHHHGPAFTYVLQSLYRSYLQIPEDGIRVLLEKNGLPAYTQLPN